MKLSVIISTYNSPAWLEKVLWGYQTQSVRDFELLIADDGSTAETTDLINQMRGELAFPVRHILQEDRGFRKCEILNKAVDASHGEYLVFSDGDCIPRSDFLQQHDERKEIGFFLSGGAVRLPLELSRRITREDILTQEAFDQSWLMKNGLKCSFLKKLKLTQNRSFSDRLNRITPTKATWNGGNSSAWKRDILAVNGFNERMGYGAEDREFGARLLHIGLHGIQVRYSAICIHLDHGRDYRTDAALRESSEIYQDTIKTKKTWTSDGITKRDNVVPFYRPGNGQETRIFQATE